MFGCFGTIKKSIQCDGIGTRQKFQKILRDAALVDNVWMYWYLLMDYRRPWKRIYKKVYSVMALAHAAGIQGASSINYKKILGDAALVDNVKERTYV